MSYLVVSVPQKKGRNSQKRGLDQKTKKRGKFAQKKEKEKGGFLSIARDVYQKRRWLCLSSSTQTHTTHA